MKQENLKRTLQILGLAGAIAALPGCREETNYFPGTDKGRLARTVREVTDVSKIERNDIGSYVIDQNDQKGGRSLVRSGHDKKVRVYSSRMDAQGALDQLREQNPGKMYDLTQIIDTTYSTIRSTGTLNGLR